MKSCHCCLFLLSSVILGASLTACSSSSDNTSPPATGNAPDATTDSGSDSQTVQDSSSSQDSAIPNDATIDADSAANTDAGSDVSPTDAAGDTNPTDTDAKPADSGPTDSGPADSGPTDAAPESGFQDAAVDSQTDAAAAKTDCEKIAELDKNLAVSPTDAGKKTLVAQFIADISSSEGFPIRCGAQVSFLFDAPSSYTAPYVAGDFNAFSQTASKMTKITTSHYRATLDVTTGANRFLYKFTSGGNWMADPLARRFGFDSNGEYSLVSGGTSKGHLERHAAIGGVGLSPRPLTLYLPPGYEASADSYRVLYAHDGQNLFDPNAAYGSWALDKVTEDQINQKKIYPLVIVGIHNTSDRMNEYTHVADVVSGQTVGGKGDAYYDLIATKIMPDIQKRYRVKTGPENTYTMGSSLGGLISIYFGMKHPEVFGKVSGLSSTVGWGSIELHNKTLIELLPTLNKPKAIFYLDSGGDDGGSAGCVDTDNDGIQDDALNASDNYCETVQLRDVFVAQGYTYNTNIFHWHEAGAQHNEAAWSARVFRPLQAMAGITP